MYLRLNGFPKVTQKPTFDSRHPSDGQLRSNTMNASQLRASYINCLSANAMNYWGTIRRTMQVKLAAQLLPPHGNPANALIGRFV
jgi:hypothetical protein